MSSDRIVDVTTGELVRFDAGRLSAEQVRDRSLWLRDVTRAALVEHVDFGIFPGTDRMSLLKPGAERLLLAAGLGFTITKIDDDDSRAHRGVTYRCRVHRGDPSSPVAECDGYAGYDESRYYKSAEVQELVERDKAKRERRPPNVEKMLEYRAPWNTLVKMAQKRALVGAVLNAVAGSGLFAPDDDPTDEPPASRPAPNRQPSNPGPSSRPPADDEPPF